MRTVLSLAFVIATTTSAAAHFRLVAPDNWADQDLLGGPQKSRPCGQADFSDPAVPTNAVTSVRTGTTLMVTVSETVEHPGHFYVALANDMNGLPPNPAVTPSGNDECASTVINTNPQLPLLADGMLPHTSQLQGNQSFQVQLPAGMRCTNCVLQVVQYMRNHDAPCFYHHCAMLTISDTAPPPHGDGVPTTGDDGAGCCSARGGAANSAAVAGVLAMLLLRRRRVR